MGEDHIDGILYASSYPNIVLQNSITISPPTPLPKPAYEDHDMKAVPPARNDSSGARR